VKTINVEKGIPVPVKYPFKHMEVGDSFEVPAHVKRTAINVAAKRHGNKYGMIFTIRFTEDRKLRCWRIE